VIQGETGLLPGGYWDTEGVLHREFELAMLTGRDEELLVRGRHAQTASLVTSVLSRGVRRLGNISPVPEDVIRHILVADRQYLLLKLRQFTFGDLVRANVFCPWPECGRRVSLEFGVDDVPVEEARERAAVYRMTLSPAACGAADSGQDPFDREVQFRLPDGADQEMLSPLLAENEAEALSRLLIRAIQRIGRFSPPSADRVLALSSLAREEIEAEMERLAPKVELTMDTACPECGRAFAVPFDLHRFFFGELRTDSDLLYREVHYLAYHYHWGEGEIMAMPRDTRQRYIERLADEIERLNDGD
jgi:hypothetical protein